MGREHSIGVKEERGEREKEFDSEREKRKYVYSYLYASVMQEIYNLMS